MTSTQRDSFLKGAFILTGAGLLVRMIGVIQRIPLYNLLGSVGAGISALPYPLYAIMLSISSVGINVAISRLIAEHLALGDGRGAARVFRVSIWMMGSLGLLLTGLLLAFSRPIAEAVHGEPRAFLSYIATAPAIFFVSVMSAYRGYFQGLQRMTPNANSQVLEQVIRVITMLGLAYWLLPRGLEWAAAGANFGAATGAIGAWLYLWVLYRRQRSADESRFVDSPTAAGRLSASRVGVFPLMLRILQIALPISATGAVLPLIQLIDSTFVTQRLQAMGLDRDTATAQFGQLANVASPLVNLPTILTSSLFVALVPAIAELAVVGDRARIRTRSETALRATFVMTLPAMVGLYILGDEIAAFLFDDVAAGPVLKALTAGTLFLALQQTTSGILQGLGHVTASARNMLIGAAVKAVLTYVLTAMPAFGVNGAAYASVIGFLFAAGLNVSLVTTLIGNVINYADTVVRPGVAAAAMAIVARGVYAAIVGAPWLPSRISARAEIGLGTIGAIGVGAVVYGVAMLLIGGLRAPDFELIPRFGPRIARTLRALHLLRG